jgi:deoxycytidylate deaminase
MCIHAEQRAIANAARSGISINDSTLYVNLRPCLQCLAISKAAGVHEVFFSEDWKVPEKIEQVYRSLCEQFAAFGRVP